MKRINIYNCHELLICIILKFIIFVVMCVCRYVSIVKYVYRYMLWYIYIYINLYVI